MSASTAVNEARAVLVGVDLGAGASFDATLDELALLAESAGDTPVARLIARRKAPDAALFLGSGKADELKALVAESGGQCVIFDQALSPTQQRNLERHLGVEVLDRTGLILEIFAARAQSHEGKLQVELAQLQYLSNRLVRRWTHLERQRGGVGHRGGPGERQIELDRRMIGERIKALKARLDKVKRQRGTQRRSRERAGTFRVSLIGYTNAGKSTLFNALVKARSYAADQLFATLDTTTRQLYLEDAQRSVSLSDTVGFIRDLPHTLVKAFAATLQEAADADLLLHVVDASSPVLAEQRVEVERVLAEIDAAGIPQILVYNKLDQLDEEQRPRVLVDRLELDGGRRIPRVFVSALRGVGLAELRALVSEALLADGGEAGAPGASVSDAPVRDVADAAPSDHDPIPASVLLQRHA
ncbi:GTPase HflX [Methylibium petroleiphilum]|uniref:GTPase HflX n=1 Tax=Methylibium petroleiphilum (strain ATCC BAA-1232 / LMG 22953 / PM1) TaxID=420662 RepID=A2SHA9_METPP|nr:GTPase HflX [Methylibium petroleiphilum]ABM94948.1 putative GTP-binding protein [Methylibium petroleiphilum PM1]